MKVVKFETNTSEEKIIRLELKDVGFDGVTLYAVDAHGTPEPAGHICTITHGGGLKVHQGIRKSIGLKLTSHDSSIKIERF